MKNVSAFHQFRFHLSVSAIAILRSFVSFHVKPNSIYIFVRMWSWIWNYSRNSCAPMQALVSLSLRFFHFLFALALLCVCYGERQSMCFCVEYFSIAFHCGEQLFWVFVIIDREREIENMGVVACFVLCCAVCCVLVWNLNFYLFSK